MTGKTHPLIWSAAALFAANCTAAPQAAPPAHSAGEASEHPRASGDANHPPLSQVESRFTAETDKDGALILEGGRKVLYYRATPRVPVEGSSARNNYVHPLYGPNGGVLTEDAPGDHPHHRGLFWAWHQVHSEGKRVGDGWDLTGIDWSVSGFQFESDEQGRGVLHTEVEWKPSGASAQAAFIHETQAITVHPLQDGIQRVDFELELTALKDGVTLGGSENEKGYGGFAPRLVEPSRLRFRSEAGPVEPQNLQVRAADWMDMAWAGGEESWPDGVTVVCRAGGAGVTQWILRNGQSMQNCAFPGQAPLALERGEPLRLVASLIVRSKQAGSNYWSETLPRILSDLRR